MAVWKTASCKDYLTFFTKCGDSDPTKRTGQVYLDFKKKEARLETGRLVTAFDLDIDFGTDPVPANFYVGVADLKRITSVYPELTILEKSFSSGRDTFTLSTLNEEPLPFTFMVPGPDIQPLELGTEVLESLNAAALFMSPDPVSNKNGLFLKGDRLIGTDLRRFYEETFTGDFNWALPSPLLSFLLDCTAGFKGQLSKSADDRVYLLTSEATPTSLGFRLQVPIQTSLTIHDSKDPKFIASYNHPNSIILDNAKLLDIVSFLDPFVASATNNRVLLQFEPESTLCLKIVDGAQIERRINFESGDSAYFEGNSIWLSTKHLIKILRLIKTATVEIQISFKHPAVNLKPTGTASNWHVAYVRLKDAGV